MQNIFNDDSKRKIPKNLSECVITDKSAKELFSFAEKIEKRARISAGIVAAIGFITSLIIYGVLNNSNQDYYYTESRNTPAGLVILIGWLITAFISYIIYSSQHLSALQIHAFATIVDNTTTTTNLQIYFLQKQLNEIINIPKNPLPKKEVWVCPHCKNENEKSHLICDKCGYGSNSNKSYWICPKCKLENPIKDNICKCGFNVNDELTEDELLTIICPNCNEELYFENGTTSAVCPHCETKFNI